MIDIGSAVRLIDHSYSVDLQLNGVLTQVKRAGGYHSGHKLQVVAINCDFPAIVNPSLHGIYSNDTLVFDETVGVYFFTKTRFLQEVCSTCGK